LANWLNPLLSSLYTDVLTTLKSRDVDSATLFLYGHSNQSIGSIKFNRATNVFEEWDGTTWVVKSIGVVGGGTGSTTAGGARTNLGLGSIATQNANSIAISGGLISGLSSLVMAGPIGVSADNVHDIGSNTLRFRNIFIRSGAVAPVGTDKWVVA
jgi:hypothetical protein